VSYQCTYLGPAVGTRDFEPAAKTHAIFRRVGRHAIPQAFQDGNHVVASRHPRPWQQQLNILRAYATFYNPINLLRTLSRIREDALGPRRVMFQLVGQIGLLLTIPRLIGWAWRLKRGPIEAYRGLAPARIPMIDSASGNEINWAIGNVPSLTPVAEAAIPSAASIRAAQRVLTKTDGVQKRAALPSTRPAARTMISLPLLSLGGSTPVHPERHGRARTGGA
jgi:hypothetical protein